MDGEIIVYRPAIPASDLAKVQDILSRTDVFVSAFDRREADPYDVRMYIEQELRYRKSFRLIVDRNLITRWVGLLDGSVATEQHRLAAAVMVFAQCANIMIEPSIALYELAATTDNATANVELSRFRIADNVPTRSWAEIALGRTNKLIVQPKDWPIIRRQREQAFDHALRRWRRNYVFVLKLAELHLRGGSSEDRMAEMLRWMYEDFFIGGPALRLAIQYLAPGAERRRLLKGIESSNREKAIAGIRNATWDLTLLSYFLEKIHEEQAREVEGTLWMLCSLERHVLPFARSLVGDHGRVDPGTFNQMSYTFQTVWGPEVGERLGHRLQTYRTTADNSHRQLHRDVPSTFINDLISAGEAKVRSWEPKRANKTLE